jgi:PTS system mannose-specific IIC component
MGLWNFVAIAALWGGLLALERNAILQAMFSRPLVASVVTGLLLQDVPSGLAVGFFFELFHLGGASLGGRHPDNEMLPAVMAAASASTLAAALGAPGTPTVWAASILLFAPFGRIGRALEETLDGRASRLSGKAEASAAAGNLRRAARQNLWGMWPHFITCALLCGAAAWVGHALAPIENRLPLSMVKGLAWVYPALCSVAAAVAVRGSNARYAFRYAALGALLVLGAGAQALFMKGRGL